MNGVFVTATDTGVGKTFVSRVILSSLIAKIPVAYFKPVQSGCTVLDDGSVVAPDVAFVNEKIDLSGFLMEDSVPYRLVPECSPHLAAIQSSIEIQMDRIVSSFKKLSDTGAFVVAEGAGGVYAPISQTLSMIDIMKVLGMPILLVTSPRIGTLNHTRLTLEALGSNGLVVAGVIFNNHADSPRDAIYCDNLATITALAAPAPVMELPHNATTTPAIEALCHELCNRI